MAERAEHGRFERVEYRPLVVAADVAPWDRPVQEALDWIETLEGELTALLADPRLAKRLRRVVRQETSESLRAEIIEGAAVGLRPPNLHATARYVEVAAEAEALPFPRDAADLSYLHGHLTGDSRVPLRTVAAELRGTEATLRSPEPDAVAAAVDRALEWARVATQHPAIVGSVLAGEMLAIRPFKRGDALMSRLLLRLVLQSNGLGAAGDLVVDRKVDLTDPTCVDLLVESVARETPHPWISCVLARLKEGLEETLADARFGKRYLDILNERQWRLADWFRRADRSSPEGNWRFREIHAAFASVPPRTLKRDLAKLREAGILEMEGKLKSARYRFIAERTPERTTVPGMS